MRVRETAARALLPVARVEQAARATSLGMYFFCNEFNFYCFLDNAHFEYGPEKNVRTKIMIYFEKYANIISIVHDS